jgi:hypothetical protein
MSISVNAFKLAQVSDAKLSVYVALDLTESEIALLWQPRVLE